MKNRTIIVIVIFGILTGCKSFDPDFLNATGNAFNPKLPAMETAVENNLVAVVTMSGQTIGASPQDILTLFDREVSEKMTNPYSDKRGYLLLKVNTIENKSCFLYHFLSGFFLFQIFLVCHIQMPNQLSKFKLML